MLTAETQEISKIQPPVLATAAGSFARTANPASAAGLRRRQYGPLNSRWVSCIPGDRNSIPNQPGVYVIYIDDSIAYVGSSTTLRNRLKSYRFKVVNTYKGVASTPFGRGVALIKYSTSRKLGEWLMREVRLINRLKPPHNVRDNPRLTVKSFKCAFSPPLLILCKKSSREFYSIGGTEIVGVFTDLALMNESGCFHCKGGSQHEVIKILKTVPDNPRFPGTAIGSHYRRCNAK